jgi:phage terminase large subunit GpA-like protein
MIPIVRAAASVKYKRITAVLCAQSGKTEGLLNLIGHQLDDNPKPVLYIGPTQKAVESISNDRFIKMFRSAPSLWEKLAKGKKNKITEKFVSGVRFGLGWAGSKTELAGHPARLVVLDERDRMEEVKGEGDPVELAEGRISNFADGRVCIVSTPTLGNVMTERDEYGIERWAIGDSEQIQSPIWKLWQEGTRHEWAWPCPECSEYFIPRFRYLKWPDGATPSEAARLTMLACPHCGSLIKDEQKTRMNERGLYLAPGQRVVQGELVGDEAPGNSASFWVSGLCSPWRTFGQRANAFLSATRSGDRGRIQAVVNIQMGECYHLGADAIPARDVETLREGYVMGAVPLGVQVLTMGVDVQKDRLIYAVRGWGYNSESWLIEHGELWGETEFDAVWIELAGLLEREFDGRSVRLALIDSGWKPGESKRTPDNQIYLFCRRFRGRVHPTKGHDQQDKPYKATTIDVTYKGKIIKNGMQLWHLDSDYFKSWVHARLQWPRGESGAWHLPNDATGDYCAQMVAETRLLNAAGKPHWVKLAAENHFLDCEALNVAAAHILRVPQTLRRIERETDAEPQQTAVKPQPAAPAQQKRTRTHSRWMDYRR